MSAKKKPTLQDVVSDDLNYEIWAPIMRTTLLEKRLWDVVENGVPPDPSKIPEIAAKLQPEEVSKWRDIVLKDIKALQILQSSLPDSIFRKTFETTSSKDLWDSLKEANEKVELQKKLEAVKIKVSEGNSSSKRGGKGNNRENALLPEFEMLAFNIGHVTFDEDMWMLYTTTTNHMTPYVKYFTTLDRSYRARVRFLNGNTTMAEGIGDVKILTKEGTITLTNVLYVPGINRNVISVLQSAERGFHFIFDASKCTIKNPSGRLIAESLWDEQRCYYLRNIRKF